MDDKNYKSDKKSLCNNAAEIEPKKKNHTNLRGYASKELISPAIKTRNKATEALSKCETEKMSKALAKAQKNQPLGLFC